MNVILQPKWIYVDELGSLRESIVTLWGFVVVVVVVSPHQHSAHFRRTRRYTWAHSTPKVACSLASSKSTPSQQIVISNVMDFELLAFVFPLFCSIFDSDWGFFDSFRRQSNAFGFVQLVLAIIGRAWMLWIVLRFMFVWWKQNDAPHVWGNTKQIWDFFSIFFPRQYSSGWR